MTSEPEAPSFNPDQLARLAAAAAAGDDIKRIGWLLREIHLQCVKTLYISTSIPTGVSKTCSIPLNDAILAAMEQRQRELWKIIEANVEIKP